MLSRELRWEQDNLRRSVDGSSAVGATLVAGVGDWAPHCSQWGVSVARVAWPVGAASLAGSELTAALSSHTTSHALQIAAEPTGVARPSIPDEQNGQGTGVAAGTGSDVHMCCAALDTWRSTAMPITAPPQLVHRYWRNPSTWPVMRMPEQPGHLTWSVPTPLVSARVKQYLTAKIRRGLQPLATSSPRRGRCGR